MVLYKRIFQGITYSGINQTLNIIQQVILVPLFLKVWGADSYGEWLVITALVSYLALGNLGMHEYAINQITQAWAKKDLDRLHCVYHSASVLFFVIGFLMTIIGEMLAWGISQYCFIVCIKSVGKLTLFLTISALVLEFSYSFLFGLWSSVYRAIQEYPRGVLLQNFKVILQIFVTGGLLLFGAGWFSVAISRFLISALIAIIAIIDVQRRHRSLKAGVRCFSKAGCIEMAQNGSWFFGTTLAHAVTIQGSVLILQAICGPVAVTVFSVTRTLVNLIRQLRAVVYHTLWPEITSWDATQETGKLRNTYLSLQKCSMFFSAYFAVVLIFEGSVILRLWVGDKILPDMYLISVLMLQLVLQSSWVTSQAYALAVNEPRVAVIPHLAGSVIGILVGAMLTQFLGPTGMVIGMTLGELVSCAWYLPMWVRRRLGLSFSEVWGLVWRPSALAVIGGVAVGSLVAFFVQGILPQLVLVCIVTLASMIAIQWPFLTEWERIAISSWKSVV